MIQAYATVMIIRYGVYMGACVFEIFEISEFQAQLALPRWLVSLDFGLFDSSRVTVSQKHASKVAMLPQWHGIDYM